MTGSVTVQAPGGAQALRRKQRVEVTVDGRVGAVPRPSLVGALVVKAAAHTTTSASGGRRHREDFADLAALVRARDLADERTTATDRRYLRRMIEVTRADRETVLGREQSLDGLARLERWIARGSSSG